MIGAYIWTFKRIHVFVIAMAFCAKPQADFQVPRKFATRAILRDKSLVIFSDFLQVSYIFLFLVIFSSDVEVFWECFTPLPIPENCLNLFLCP